MRLLFSGLVAAGLLTSQTAGAACAPPSEREALDVAGLKSFLMVVTLTCNNDDQYNAFVNKFRSEVPLPTPDELRAMIVEELPFWAKIIHDNNIKGGA